VNFVTTVYKRFQQLIHEGAKFCVVGGTGAVVTLGGADILHNHMAVGKYTSITVATLVATVVTFVGNRYWTFRHRSGKGTTHESVMFFVLNGVGLLIGYACIWLVTGAFGWGTSVGYDFANFLGLVFGTVFRFWSYRKWVWHAQPAAGQQPATRYIPAHRHAQPAYGYVRASSGYAQPYLEEPPTVNLGLMSNGHEAREPELVPPPWSPAPSVVPPSGPASVQRPDGPRHVG
jgi:putative flippase GtrA